MPILVQSAVQSFIWSVLSLSTQAHLVPNLARFEIQDGGKVKLPFVDALSKMKRKQPSADKAKG